MSDSDFKATIHAALDAHNEALGKLHDARQAMLLAWQQQQIVWQQMQLVWQDEDAAITKVIVANRAVMALLENGRS